jgi:hypothetical protein
MLMAAWTGKDELNPLCKINAIPKTLEDFIGAYSDTSIVRTVKESSSYETDPKVTIRYAKDQKNSSGASTKNDLDSRKTSDITCDACGMHGHGWKTVIIVQNNLNVRNLSKTWMKNKKQDLMDCFAKEQLCRRTLKLRNRPASVRFLYNQTNRLAFGRPLQKLGEEIGIAPDMQHGLRVSKLCHSAVLNKQLTFDIH